MTKVRFNLVKSKADAKECHIRLVFRYAGKKLVYYPGHTTTPEKWSAKDQRLKRTAPHAAIINERLTAISTLVEKTFLEYDTAVKEKDFSTVEGVRILSMLTKKTDTRISVPVLPMAERILARCGGMPRYITNQKLNRYIKEACRAAGIVEQVVTVRISAGRRVEERHAKYELVTTHTARRSFATNEYLRAIREGRDWRPIMAITGHRKESQFFDYIRITSEENAVLFSRQRGAKAG